MYCSASTPWLVVWVMLFVFTVLGRCILWSCRAFVCVPSERAWAVRSCDVWCSFVCDLMSNTPAPSSSGSVWSSSVLSFSYGFLFDVFVRSVLFWCLYRIESLPMILMMWDIRVRVLMLWRVDSIVW